jgi:hypothetical protein
MRLYSSEHLKGIDLNQWAWKNLEVVYLDSTNPRLSAHTYFIPTLEFEEMVKQNNVIAALKGAKKLCKPVYKPTYFCKRTNKLVISSQ